MRIWDIWSYNPFPPELEHYNYDSGMDGFKIYKEMENIR